MPSTIQKNIPILQLTDMRSYTDEFIATLLWMGHMCCRGDFMPVLDFLKSQSAQLQVRYVNETHDEFWYGTLLHMITLWNSGPDAFDMYNALRSIGAIPTKDYYGTLPWEIDSTCYLTPCDHTNYGIRIPIHFSPLYTQIREWEELRPVNIQHGH